MTFKGTYYFGVYEELAFEFEDEATFLIWERSMDQLQQELPLLVTTGDNGEYLRSEDLRYVRNWIRRVDEIEEANQPVVPSILMFRNAFVEAFGYLQHLSQISEDHR